MNDGSPSSLDYSKPGGASAFAAAFAAGAKRGMHGGVRQPPPTARPGGSLVARLASMGYLNCSLQYDELKDGCMAMRPDYDWLQYAWTRGRSPGGADPPPPSPAAQAVSWWLQHGVGDDPFDAEAFLRGLARLGLRALSAGWAVSAELMLHAQSASSLQCPEGEERRLLPPF